MRGTFAAMVMTAMALTSPPLAPAGPTTSPSPAVVVNLKLVPLETPACLVARSDAAEPNQRLSRGMLVGRSGVSISSLMREYGWSLAGHKLCLEMKGQDFFLNVDGQQQKLKRNGPGYEAVTLSGSQREYLLAFPFGYVYSQGGSLFCRSGAVQQGMLGEQALSFYDDNTDGRYTLADDCMALSGADDAVTVLAPASKLLATPTRLWQIQTLEEDGSAVTLEPYSGPTAKLSVASSFQDMEVYAALGSDDGQLNFVATARPKGGCELTVVPGTYRLLYGAVYSPKSNQIVALLGPGPSVRVAADQTQAIQLGGPLKLEFTINKTGGNSIRIDSSSLKLKGPGGAECRAYNWAANVPPEIAVARGSTVQQIGKMEYG